MFTQDFMWWIAAVDIPALAGLLALIWQSKREFRRDIDALSTSVDSRLDHLRDGVSAFQLDVAKTYASHADVGALESRLVAHLLRIEAKLDSTALKAEAVSAAIRNEGRSS